MSGDTEVKPLTFHDVAELLERLSQGEGSFRRSTQRRVYEYIQKFLFTTKGEIEKIIEQLEKLNIPRKIAIQMAYLLPITREELSPFFSQLRQMKIEIKDEERLMEEIIRILMPMWEQKHGAILSLRNLSLSALKKSSKE